MQQPIIVGISGISGAGKSTIATKLAEDLKASLICWDDFDSISKFPEDYIKWHSNGKDYNEWNYQSLSDSLKTLKSNTSITHPVFNTIIYPTNYIIFDSPLGYLHKQTGRYIDICIHITVPLDVSLARRIIRDYKDPGKTKKELLEELELYLTHSRPLFFDDHIKEAADIVIDGMESVNMEIALIKQFLSNKRLQNL